LSHFFLARQPIFDRKLQVFAYELLFRDSRDNAHRGNVGDDASTARVITNAMDLGLARLTRGHPAFINLPQQFLEDPDLLPLDTDLVVPEILETVTLSDACLQGLRTLRERGYRLALDDFVDTNAFNAVLPMIDIVKLDVLALPQEAWATQIQRLREHGCKILAEKVETLEAFETLRALRVDYFQGYFFARPRIVRGRRLAPSRVNVLHTLARLNDPEICVDEIHALVSRDAALSVKALNYVNSAANGLSRRVESIREAIIYLGRDTIRRWVSLYALATEDSGPEERLTLAIQRAKLCELVGARIGHPNPDACFTVGLFSMLDVLLDTPLEDILAQMPLSHDMRTALLEHAGECGDILAAVQRWEAGETAPLHTLDITEESGASLQEAALAWTDDTLRDLGMD
jgi:EAL and modified HD-GYP domain-containing signal transduction protein